MEKLGIDHWLLLWQGIAFLILLWALGRYAYQPILRTLDDRANRIRESMAQAEQIKRELAAAQQTAQQVIAEARKESEQIRAQNKQQADRIIAAAEAEAREVREKRL